MTIITNTFFGIGYVIAAPNVTFINSNIENALGQPQNVGVLIDTGPATVVNSGSIVGADGIEAAASAVVRNYTSGIIAGDTGILGTNPALYVQNAGHIIGFGASGAGVALRAGGTIANLSGGSIAGASGIAVYGGAATVVNAGYIGGNGAVPDGVGVYLAGGGTVTNMAGATIDATGVAGADAVGILAKGGATTVVNAGHVMGGGYAIDLAQGFANRVVLDPSGPWSGGVVDGGNSAGSSAVSTLELAAGAGYGVIGGLGMLFVGFNAVAVDSGANWTMTGDNTIPSGVTLQNAGTLTDSGTIAGGGVVDNTGVFDVSRLVSVAGLTGSGYTALGAGATLAASGQVGAGQTIAFGGAGGVLRAPSIGGTITNFAALDTIDLTGFVATGDSFAGNQLVLTNASAGTVTLSLTGAFGSGSFALAGDGATGTDITLACFAEGTRIATPSGEVAVEKLRAGDLVLSAADGWPRTIRWVGHRAIDCARHPAPERVLPVRVSRGAFGAGMPARDLYLSPDHAVYADGVLVPVRYLINGDSVARADADAVVYYHIELEAHDVVLAEGLAVESYLDIGDRSNFNNSEGAVRLFADFAAMPPADIWEAKGYAPLVVHGPAVEAIRARLGQVAAVALARSRRVR